MYDYGETRTALIQAGIAEEAIRPGNHEWAAIVEGHGGISRLSDDEWIATNPGMSDTPLTGRDPLRLIGYRGRRGRPAIGPMVNVRIDQQTIDLLDDVAETTHATRAEVIRRAVTHYLRTQV
jgi:hypothetical protein